jgi:sugar lactone lactonase YvrE
MSNCAGKVRIGVIAIFCAAALATVGLHRSSGRAYSATPDPALFVTNHNGVTSDVTAYPGASSGDQAPAATISGGSTDLNLPEGIALDSSGNIYVADAGAASVFVYSAGSNGNAAPIATISGGNTGLTVPIGIALDSIGNIYVTDQTATSVFVYPALGNSTGTLNEAPTASISGDSTELSTPAGIAVDSSGKIYVADSGAASVFVYPALGSSTGTLNEAPTASISGGSTELSSPAGIAVDSSGNIYVADSGAKSVFVYPALGGSGWVSGSPATYTVAPTASISGSSTGLTSPNGIALDSLGKIYAADAGAESVFVYPPLASLPSQPGYPNVTPSTTISGAQTGLAGPQFIAIQPSLLVQPHGIVFYYSIVLNSGTTAPTRVVTATNQSGGPITIGTVTVSPTQFSMAYDHCSNTTLQPGHTCTVGVNFTASPLATDATTQTWTGTVTVPSGASTSPNVTTLEGTGIAGLIGLSPTIAFPNTLVGTTTATTRTAKLTNPYGKIAMTIDSVGVTGDFSIVSDGCNTGTPTTPTTLAASSSCTVTVKFAPTAQGIRTGSLQIVSNARNALASSPGTIKLQGTGTLSPLTFSPTALSFPKQTVDTTSADKEITVANNNTYPVGGAVAISSIIPSKSVFSVDSTTCGSSLAPQTTCNIYVNFKPTATGTISATLNIVDNAGNGTQKAGLYGIGK